MELIFGKQGYNGLQEMQGYFSNIPGTIEFKALKNDILLAQEELQKYVGEGVILEAVKHYQSNDFKYPIDGASDYSGSGGEEMTVVLLKNDLVYHVQMAVVYIGYRQYALNNDATHTKTGRRARMDKDSDEFNEKLIDRDDIALQRKEQKAIDRLIRFVHRNNFKAWEKSDLYKSTRDLILWSADLFERFHSMEESYRLYRKLVPAIRSVQREVVAPVLGEGWLRKLLAYTQATDSSGSGTDISGSGSSTTATVEELFEYTGYTIAYLAISRGYSELPVMVFPESMSRNFFSAGNGASYIALRDKMIEAEHKEGMKKLQELQSCLERIKAKEEGIPITEDKIITIAERMKSGNKFARV